MALAASVLLVILPVSPHTLGEPNVSVRSRRSSAS